MEGGQSGVPQANALASFVNGRGISPNRCPWTHASEPRPRGTLMDDVREVGWLQRPGSLGEDKSQLPGKSRLSFVGRPVLH
jgi:hypothetical protein